MVILIVKQCIYLVNINFKSNANPNIHEFKTATCIDNINAFDWKKYGNENFRYKEYDINSKINK